MSGRPYQRNPFEWFFHICLLILGGALALNWALGLLAPLIPWIVLAGILAVAVAVLLARRRNRW